jgi:adenylosuccinate synthase
VRAWDDLPENARKYVERVQELIGVECRWIGVGPGRDAIVIKPPSDASRNGSKVPQIA